jgi:hypothetical protein
VTTTPLNFLPSRLAGGSRSRLLVDRRLVLLSDALSTVSLVLSNADSMNVFPLGRFSSDEMLTTFDVEGIASSAYYCA